MYLIRSLIYEFSLPAALTVVQITHLMRLCVIVSIVTARGPVQQMLDVNGVENLHDLFFVCLL